MSVRGSTSRPFMTWLPASSAPTNFAPPGSPNRRKPRPPLSPLDGFETASKLPVGGEGTPVRAGLDPRRPLLAQGRDVLLGMALQVGQVGVLEAGPDLGLPPAV